MKNNSIAFNKPYLTVKEAHYLYQAENSMLAHHMVIKDHVTITSHCAIGGNVIIEEQVFIGQNASLRNNIRIGKGAIIGTSANVVKDVDEYSVMIGNPAKATGIDSRENKN